MALQFCRKQKVGHLTYPTNSIMHLKRVIMSLYHKCFNRHCTGTLLTLYSTVLILILTIYPCTAQERQQPGCHMTGYIRRVKIPDCMPFRVKLNGCIGYCESYALPSTGLTLSFSRHQITSRAECCTMGETQDKEYPVRCRGGIQHVVIKSALSCSCSVCRS